jgi:hypothetical protein
MEVMVMMFGGKACKAVEDDDSDLIPEEQVREEDGTGRFYYFTIALRNIFVRKEHTEGLGLTLQREKATVQLVHTISSSYIHHPHCIIGLLVHLRPSPWCCVPPLHCPSFV